MEKQKNGVGRRKEAVTRVFLSKGDGKITVNDKDYKEYFQLVYLQNQVEQPLKALEATDKFDIKINATGGGLKVVRVVLLFLQPTSMTLAAAGAIWRKHSHNGSIQWLLMNPG